jgi:hypothetical protein
VESCETLAATFLREVRPMTGIEPASSALSVGLLVAPIEVDLDIEQHDAVVDHELADHH